MRFRVAASLFLVATLQAAEPPADTERVFEAYPVTVPDATMTVEAARMIVGERGKVLYDRTSHKLLVYAPASEHVKIADMMNKTTTPAVNIRVDVVVDETANESRTGASVTGDGTVTVDPRGKARTDVSFKPSVTHQSTDTSRHAVQSLVVISGGTASFDVGREVPYSDWLIQFGRQWGYIRQEIQTRKVGTSLRIFPRLMENGLIAIKLVPEISTLTDDGDVQRVQFINVATELVVQDGQTITFGGADQHKDFFDRFLIGFSQEGRQSRMQMTLTPHVMRVTAAPAAKP